MMYYYAKIIKQPDKKYLVEFPEVDGCFTEGDSLKEALFSAKEALDGVLAVRCDYNLDIRPPKLYKKRNYYPIEVDLKIAFAISLRSMRMKKGLSQAIVAKKLGISQQAYAKLESPTSNPSLETIKRISIAFDAKLDLKLVS